MDELKTVRFTIFDQPESNELGEYLCDSPGDLSGEYVRADEVRELVEAIEAALRIESLWCESGAMNDREYEHENAALYKMRERFRAALAKHTKGPTL